MNAPSNTRLQRLHTFEVVLPREIVATATDVTFEFSGMLPPESTGSEGVDSSNLGLWILAEDLSDVTFLNGMARAGHLNPVFAHRLWVTLAFSQIEAECPLCRERTWNRVLAWMIKWGVAVIVLALCRAMLPY
jgi:hypothetical protein